MKSTLIAFLILFQTSTAFSADMKKVVLATLTGYAPFTFGPTKPVKNEKVPVGKDSKDLKGLDWDIVRESFHAMGTEIELHVVPWKRAVKMMETGKADILFATTKTEERINKGYLYSAEPIHTMKVTLYTKKESKINWDGDLKNLKSILKDKKIGARRGFSMGTWWDDNKEELGEKIYEVDDESKLWKVLDKGRVDLVIAYDIPSDLYLQEQSKAPNYKKIGKVSESPEFLSSHNEHEGQKVLDVFNAGQKKISESGKLKEIMNKWGQN